VTLLLLLALAAGPPAPCPGFVLKVVDEATGRGVPLVTLKLVDGSHLVTDSGGVAVFDEPGMMGREVYFEASSPGYVHAPDGFGMRGRVFKAVPGGSAVLRLKREQLAERLYRVTGAGIYRDSFLAARAYPIRQPLLNADVTGSDSVLMTEYRGKLFWLWGDTNRPRYPLGNFHVSGAVSQPPTRGGLPASVGIDLEYFTGRDGFAAEMCRMPGDGPTWATSLFVAEGRLIASYVKVKPPLTPYRRGLAAFDDRKQRFVPHSSFPMESALHPTGHALRHEGHFYFCTPFPTVRVKADLKSIADPEAYEGLTAEGWKRGAAPIRPTLQGRATAKKVEAHSGSVAYNPFRRKWILITVEKGGKASFLGEVWYAESEALEGPWSEAVQVATHPRYDFYNPRLHPELQEKGGRHVFFEGTFTNTFSGNPVKVPRYDYNQILYRLDLADPRLSPRR
jgi:hypothetical protein